MSVLIIDNFDSFVFNIAQILEEVGSACEIVRNNSPQLFSAAEKAEGIVISPGPGVPASSGLLMRVLSEFAERKKILGICLGHQAVCEHFGAKIARITPQHGAQDTLEIVLPDTLFEGIRDFRVGRYHSWSVDEKTIPSSLKVIARGSDKTVMAVRHVGLKIYGVQFHPESVLTPDGSRLLENFIKM